MKLQLLTWNIQYGSSTGATPNAWPYRRPLIMAEILKAAPDVFCAQEVLIEQLCELKSGLETYCAVAEGRDGPGLGEHCPIFFRTDEFHCNASGTFWFNDDTTQPGKMWDTEYNRICTWTELTNYHDNIRFRVWNVHFPLGAAARSKAVQLLVEKIATTIPLPTLVVGDFNEPEGPAAWPALNSVGLRDAFWVAKHRIGEATYSPPGLGPMRIDWILCSPTWVVHDVRTIGSLAMGGPSDHNGVFVNLELVPEH